MIKTKSLEQKGKTFFALSVIGISLLFVGSIFAQYVPQDIGFKDVKSSDLGKEVCQECHGESLADTHHSTPPATSGDCISCHSVKTETGSVGVSVERNCTTCHAESPHHATEAALNNECMTCHDSPGVSEYSTEVPPYEPSKITPTVSSCSNCHGEGEVDGQKIVSARDTHHGISLKDCKACHGEIDLSAGEEKTGTNIRICEKCHSAKALHEVVPHVEKDSCVLCHGGKQAAAQPE